MKIGSSPVPTPIAGSASGAEPSLPMPRGAAQPPPITISMSDKKIELRDEDIARVVDKLNEAALIFNYSLRFQMVEGNRINVKVIDIASGRIVREIPPEGVMDTFSKMQDVIGVLLDARV